MPIIAYRGASLKRPHPPPHFLNIEALVASSLGRTEHRQPLPWVNNSFEIETGLTVDFENRLLFQDIGS